MAYRSVWDVWNQYERYEDIPPLDQLIVDEYEADKQAERIELSDLFDEPDYEHLIRRQ